MIYVWDQIPNADFQGSQTWATWKIGTTKSFFLFCLYRLWSKKIFTSAWKKKRVNIIYDVTDEKWMESEKKSLKKKK